MLDSRYNMKYAQHNARSTRFRLPILCITLCLCLFATCVLYAADMHDVRILETSADGLVILFQMPELKIDTKDVDGEIFHVLSFANCSFTNETGKARIPTRVITLGIPEGADPIVSVLDDEASSASGYKIYPVEETTIHQEAADPAVDQYASLSPGISYTAVTKFAIDRQFYGERRLYPQDTAKIEPVGYIRQQRLARLEIFPIQYNPSIGQLKVHKKLQIRVTFQNFSGMAPSRYVDTRDQSDVFDDLYQDTILNYDQSKNWRKSRTASSAPRLALDGNPSIQSGKKYKLTIQKKGMYKLDYNYLKIVGIDPDIIDPKKIEIMSGGEQIPIYVEGYQDGKFDPGDFIEFYATGINTLFTEDNIYWLSIGNPAAKSWMMAIKDGAPETPDLIPPVAFRDTKYWEEVNTYYDPLRKVTNEMADHFFWTSMRGQDPRYDLKENIPIHVPFRASNIDKPAKLRVCFQGVTYAKGASDHRITIALNGKDVGEAQWEGQTEYISETVLSQSDFNRTNWVTLRCNDENGTTESTDPKWDVYLNWFEVEYWREFIAENDALEFSTETVPPVTQTVQYSISGFTFPDIEVFQITRSGAIAKITNPKVEQVEDKYKVTFEDNVTQPTRYFVTSTKFMKRPTRIVEDSPSTLHDPANRVDYIMITHKNFRESANRLAEFRKKQGLAVLVVDIEDVYDEFSYGIFDPKAIQRFLRYAYFNWDKIPTYVLLIGDAHWDYKYVYHEYYVQYENYPRIYVPTYHAYSSPYGQTAMDHRFVTVSGDDILPDMFIGRLPVETLEEANEIVDKIIKYEEEPNFGQWQSRIMLVADDEKSKSGDEVFEDSRVELMENYIPVSYETIDVFLRRVEEPYIANQMINKNINNGLVMLEYAGHGGVYSWAHEYIFGWEDVKKLQNYNRHPFVITTTCENGYFDNPMGGNKCIMEMFLLQPKAGAIACLSATRLTYGQGNATFDKIIYPKIFSESPPILGKIIGAAKVDFINLGIATWLPSAEQYTLFGDPATKLALPERNIEFKLVKSSVDSSKKLELKPGTIKRTKVNSLTGQKELVTDTAFNALMQISAVYPNNLDTDKSNDLPVQKGTVNVWKGEFGSVQLDIPAGVIPGEGQLRCYANGGSSSAVGGIKFSVLKPIVEFFTDENINDEFLKIYAAVVDNMGHAGIESVECLWRNTETWKQESTVMILSEAPENAPEVEGLWYRIRENIPFSRPGTNIEYQIKVVDSEGNEAITPYQRFQIPIGVNLAISQINSTVSPSISYSYSQIDNSWILSAPVENNGGKEVKKPIAVYFFEGNPDRNKDELVDSDAEILGYAVIEYDQWMSGEQAIQMVDASIKLDEPLYSGFHQIFVWVNPRTDRLNGYPVLERVEDADNVDDKTSRLFQINDFLVGKGDQPTLAQSLDGTLSMLIPPDSVDETVMSITRLQAPEPKWEQPDLSPAPIPEYESNNNAFKIQFASGVTSLRAESEINIKFDAIAMREFAKKSKGLEGKAENELSDAEREWVASACQEEAKKLGIFAWQEDIGSWRYVPSSLLMDEEKKEFAQEPYVTIPISSNRSKTQLDANGIMIDEIVTPLGNWVMLFLDSETYELYFRREGMSTYESLRNGKVGETYYNSEMGLTLDIGNAEDFKYGDVYKFDTYQDLDGSIKLKSLRDYNSGDGTARITIMESTQYRTISHQIGEWTILFIDSKRYGIHCNPEYLPKDATSFSSTGEVGKTLYISDIGVQIEIHEGRWPFQFGDKFVFRMLSVGTVTAQTDLVNTMILMHSNDFTLPEIQLWVNGVIPQEGTVIPPRPDISLLLSDANGIDINSLSFMVSVNDRGFHPVPRGDYVFSDRSWSINSLTNVPIFYSPILNVSKYNYRIAVKDLCGNEAENDDGGYLEFMFLVEEQPDLASPEINVTVDGQPLVNGQVFRKSPEFLINIKDDYILDKSTILLSFAHVDDSLEPLAESEYTMTLSDDESSAVITYAPHLINGEYAIQVEATDTSENTAYLNPPESGPIRLRMDEKVEVADVMNAPNPFSDTTVFSYSLTQPADKVTIKIYTLKGRPVRTLEQYLPQWQYNEEFWDGRDDAGKKLASGVYIYKFTVTDGDRKIDRIGKLAIIR